MAECIQDSVLSINNVVPLLRDISRPVELGLQLGIEYGTLQRIEKENKSDIGRQMIEVINFWLENFTGCSWGGLAKAIRSLGGHDLLADKIVRKEQPAEQKESGLIESPASTMKLTDSEKQNLEFRIKTDLDKLQKKFATLQTSVRKSLKERGVPMQDVVAHVIGFGVSDEHKKELMVLDSFDRVFIILTDYWSFLDCDLLENIVENYGCETDQEKIGKYQEELNSFCKRRISEVPNKSLVLSDDQTRERMIVKLNVNDPRLAIIKDLKIKICKVLSIEPWSLQIMEIKEGCVLLTFLMSVHISKHLSSESLMKAQCEDLKDLSVVTITYYSNSGGFQKVFPPSIKQESGDASALIDACRNGYTEIVEELIHKGVDINHQDQTGFTPLHYASKNGHVDVINLLFNNNVKCNIPAKEDKNYISPLGLACANGHTAIVELLIHKGANTSYQDKTGFTPLQYATENHHNEVVKVITNFQAQKLKSAEMVSSSSRHKGGFLLDDSKLHKLCRNGNVRKIKAYVEDMDSHILKEKMVCRYGARGYTPLHEAVASGNPEVIKFLLELTDNVGVNCRTNSGYTPLHLAAISGRGECVRELLSHGADISCLDEYGKTPKELSSKSSIIVKLLRSKEIIKEVENNGDKLTELLKNGADNLEPGCLDQALKAAVKNDNHLNVGKLVVKGAKELQSCLQYAKDEKKPHARAMLLLIIAAQTGDKAIVQKLFDEPASGLQNKQDYEDDAFGDVQKAMLSGNISTVVPIEIARRNEQSQVREELLLKTDVNQEEGYVYWHGLRLLQLDIAWLRKIAWVKKLRLARNGFKSLPPEMGIYLKQVVELDLQHNELTTIPKCLLELPSLGDLNLSNNKLTEIPDVAEWSPCLTVLDLSSNLLNNLPLNIIAPAIRSLNLGKNLFRNVPLCICSFTTLHSLTLSDNPDILTLPTEMGRLSYLSYLNLSGLKDLNDPPKNLQKNCRDCIRYLNSKLRSARGFYRMKLMLVGSANRGKTTLVARLQGKEYGDKSTVGVDLSEWWYRPSVGRRAFHFSIWDFAGQEEYYATHQCFLSQRSLYLLLFNLTHGDNSVEELKPWLNNLALRAPHSCVIIIGTHLDEVPDEERGEIDALLHRVGTLAASYNNKLQIVEVLPVGLKNRIENIGLLKEAIYNHAANYKNRGGQLIMGQKIPASYHALDKQLETVQQEVRQGIREPIMHAEEFRTMVHQMNLADIQDEDELKTAALFLTDVGSLLHYDDHGHNLHELYFIDPQWLCDMMSKVVTIKERNPFVKNGILYSKDIPMLFKDKQFPWQYFEQYLTLLDRFEIALPLDNQRILIPSMLLDNRPKEFEDEKPDSQDHVYSRFVMFNSANTPPGFWSRLLSRIMHSIPKVCHALNKSMQISEPTSSTNHCNAEREMSFSMPHLMTPTEAFSGTNANAKASLNMSTTASSGAQTPVDTSGSTTPHIPALTISDPLSLVSAQQPFISAPQLLPNFPKSISNNITGSFDAKDIHLEYWRTGLYYKDPEAMCRIESFIGSNKPFNSESKDGVLIVASMNSSGKKMIAQLVDLVVSLVGEWYPGLQEGKYGLKQKVLCVECIKQGRAKPFEFKVEQCLSLIAKNETKTECGYFGDNSTKNHTISLADIVPDLLLQDINPEFLLDAEEIIYQEDDTSLLGKGGYGKVYRGKCKGKSVAIKKYLSRTAFIELRSEAKLLQQFHHPCLVCLIGVCIHPLWALVLEEAPLKSLEFLILKKKIPVHRLTIFRIAAEVAAALCFLHSRGIIYRDLKAANILLWTLDPDSLCHCKVADLGIATHLSPIGARGLQGTKGFIAPEVLHIGKRKQRSVYDHRADIFSFGMFLYQMIARRHPYHNIPPHRIDVAVESGERPKLQDVDISRTGYHYLTQMMQTCWEDNPKNRFDTDTIIMKVCQAPTQMVMCVIPISGKQSLRRAIAITPSNFTKAGHPNRLQSELWVCCDGAEGAEVSMFNTHTLVKVNQVFIKDNQVQCMALCGDHVWAGSRAGIEYGVIDIFSVGSRELVHNVHMRENSVSCITATDKAVYLGTLEGYCFSFYNDISRVRANVKPRYKYISEHAVDGIICTQQCVWAAHTRYIYFLNFDTLALEGAIHCENEQEAYIGQLFFDPNCNIVWSAFLGRVILSAWDADNKCHLYDIDTGRYLKKISPDIKDADLLITAMTPVLDTVWVGMGSGHIMVFHKNDLLSWFHPYNGYVRFLTCIPSSGPCEMEKAIVASGGKGFRPLVEGFHQKIMEGDESSTNTGQSASGTIIMWEAYEARTIRQVKFVEESAPNHLQDHRSVCELIQQGNFKDGTLVMSDSTLTNDSVTENDNIQFDCLQYRNTNFSTATSGYGTATSGYGTQTSTAKLTQDYEGTSRPPTFSEEPDEGEVKSSSPTVSPTVTPEVHIQRVCPRATATVKETFNVWLPDTQQEIVVRCSKPVKLRLLLSKIQVTVAHNHSKLEYFRDGKPCKLQTQEQFEEYLRLPKRPQLCVVASKSKGAHH